MTRPAFILRRPAFRRRAALAIGVTYVAWALLLVAMELAR